MGSFIGLITGAVTWAAGNLGFLSFLPSWAQLGIKAAGALVGVLSIRGASVNPSQVVADWLGKLGTGWKTAFGACGAVIAYLLTPESGATLSATVAGVLQTVMVVLTGVGLYHKQVTSALAAR